MTDASEIIASIRRRLGPELTIAGHHYQAEEVIRHCDLRGDSLELARKCAALDSRWLMFCGVYFMAESAALLARPGSETLLPAPSAECSMALMSPATRLTKVLRRLEQSGRKIVPLAYVNSSLGVKAVVGGHGGAVCTSANARTMLEWALEQGDAVLFLPDKNLGWNTADLLKLAADERHILSITKEGRNIDLERAERARLLLWPGLCSIHARFAASHARRVRAADPDAKIVVHPECRPEVVQAADAAGSTSFIIRYADQMPSGGTLYIGTEINLVKRLAMEHRERLRILPLAESACPHMAKTSEAALARALESLLAAKERGGPSPFAVSIAEEARAPARAALERMLTACA